MLPITIYDNSVARSSGSRPNAGDPAGAVEVGQKGSRVLVVVGLAVMSVSIVVTSAVVAWVARAGRTAVPPEIPDAAHACAVLTPHWATDSRTLPRPLVVALIGLRAAGAVDVAGPADVAGSVDTVSGRAGTLGPLPRLTLVTTGVAQGSGVIAFWSVS